MPDQPSPEQKPKANKVMFFVGIILIIATVVILLGNFTEEGDYPFPIILGVMGIVFIGASRFRLLRKRK